MQRQSGNSKTKYVFSLCAILAVILGAGYYIFSSRPLSFQYELFSDVSLSLDEEADLTPYAKIGDSKISVEVVKDNESIRKGLSGRLSMEEDRGMLFVFSIPGIYRFWMPDMHFPIDIIWIADGKIIGAEKNVSPEFNPASPRFYTPTKPIQYVLETNAGFVEAGKIKSGDEVFFYNID
uniref:DUF192 domain-containing protein n=1 Tax=Candidatus Giovannonibacteria bacterium GW2011_GWF2_42_19 TaxID=1618659 RepID=A0A0G0ZE23_9BACT|nr:MAG: hypothetical protein UV11_C0022G0010 [Candidatus Giovannonibacteria bacterium GW2011_GWF2_42_19]